MSDTPDWSVNEMRMHSWQPEHQSFRSSHTANPHIDLDPLYALPEELLRHILEQYPDWISDEEWRFERDLQRLCSNQNAIGILFGLPLPHPNLVKVANPIVSEEDFREMGWDRYLTLESVHNSVRLGVERIDPIKDRQEAYLGWLSINPGYREEQSALRDRWGDAIAAIRKFPKGTETPLPRGDAGCNGQLPLSGHDRTDELFRDFRQFYERWQLSQLHSWDLPSALGANLGGPGELTHLMNLEQQPAVQAPSVLRLPIQVSAHAILAEAQARQIPEHLIGWLRVQDERNVSNLNYLSFQRIFRLTFYWNTVLASRYSDRFRGAVAKLDAAFAAYFGGVSTDTIRKLRRHIATS